MANAFTNDSREAVGEVIATSSGPVHSYAAPSLASGSPYTHPGNGWAAGPSVDAHRLQTQPVHTYRPKPDNPQGFWNRIGRERRTRHTVEDQDADGFSTTVLLKHAAPDPRRIPPAEPRPSQRMSPRTYTFQRPYDVSSARQLNGSHFSMAEHRRNYPILGMAPIRSARNTYRISPTPWDASLVDLPPDYEPTTVQGKIQAIEVPLTSRRSYRL